MRKILIVTLVLYSLIFSRASIASDTLCGHDELKLSALSSQNGNKDVQSFRISGVVDVPNPGYSYLLSFKSGVDNKIISGTLSLQEGDPEMEYPSVITQLKINKVFNAPNNASAIYIRVSKGFDWGPKYFKGKFIRGNNAACLSANK